MKQGLTELVCILDRSGSMYHLSEDTIGGYNSMVEQQKKDPGECYITTVLFNDQYRIIRDHVDIQEVAPLTDKEYIATGSTALLDAVGRTINAVGERLANTPEEERPEHVIFAITTDGHENDSVEYNRASVQKMVKHQTEKYSWKFIFVGAGIDAYAEAEQNFGIRSPEYIMNASATTDGVANTYSSLSRAFTALKNSAALDESWKTGEVKINIDYNNEV